jgi:hypothetical protein
MEALLRRRRNLARRLAARGRLIKASLSVNRRKCGNPRCRCSEGELHESLAFTFKDKGGGSVMVHVPAHLEQEARKAHRDYAELKELVDELSEVNLAIFKAKAKQPRKS